MRIVSDEGVKVVGNPEVSVEEGSASGEDLGSEETQLVVFKLGEEEYGVNIHDVERIIEMRDITRVPHVPSFVEGILNLRGRIVVVVT